jgi:hypothetical protein
LHVVPHEPQFMGSLPRSEQKPWHKVWPFEHAHWPREHDEPPEQTVPQEPQFQLSFEGSMHLLMHHSLSDVQRATHFPVSQRISEVHVVAHAPQCESFEVMSTHVLSQMLRPLPHSHVPLLHVALIGHALPHPPQFELLDITLMQDCPHAVSSCAHFDTHLL